MVHRFIPSVQPNRVEIFCEISEEKDYNSKNIWTVKIKIGVVRLVKSLVIFILSGWYL
jgi:hypothetical protein